MMSLIHSLAVIVMLFARGLSPAQGQIVVEVTKINGSTIRGSWLPIAEPGKIAVGTKIRQETFSHDDLIRVQFVDRPASIGLEGWDVTVWCNNGSIFPADLLAGSENDVTLKTPFAARLRVSLDDIAALKWNRPQVDSGDLMAEYLSTREESKDLLIILHEGQPRPLLGTIESLGPKGGWFSYRGKRLQFDARKTYGLVLAGSTAQNPAPAICVLDDDYRIAGSLSAVSQEHISLKGISDLSIELPVSTIREIRFNSSRVVYLSDLKPTDIQSRSVFGVDWPVRFDLAVGNRPMTMQGRRYAKGIGVHAYSEITFALDTDYRSFAATVGIDDRVRPAGQVIFRVLGDGRELFTSGLVTGQDSPKSIIVSLSGVRVLKLVVDEAEQLDIGDHANWASARLLK